MLRNLFKSNRQPQSQNPTVLSGPRIPRASSGWKALLEYLKSEPNRRVLDIGPTSPSNINFLTGLGHSVYMADLVNEAWKGNWKKDTSQYTADDPEENQWDVDGYLKQNLDFGGRTFDVILLWTTLDYIPAPMVQPLLNRFHEVVEDGGKILALFHAKMQGEQTAYCRYHLVDRPEIETQVSENFPIQRVYTNRGIEKLFTGYDGFKFFLAKDNVYEVIVTR